MISFSFWASDIFNTSHGIAVCGGLLIPMRLYFFFHTMFHLLNLSARLLNVCLILSARGDNQDHYVIGLALSECISHYLESTFFCYSPQNIA